MTEEEKIIQNQVSKLPTEVRAAINTVPWKDLVKEIAAAGDLSQEQAKILETETTLIVCGFENPADYIKNIIREVSLDEETATITAEQVNERILKAISDKVEEIKNGPVANLPMVEPGEVAHPTSPEASQGQGEVPHVESQPTTDDQQPTIETQQEKPAQAPLSSRYPGGVDPYREPLE